MSQELRQVQLKECWNCGEENEISFPPNICENCGVDLDSPAVSGAAEHDMGLGTGSYQNYPLINQLKEELKNAVNNPLALALAATTAGEIMQMRPDFYPIYSDLDSASGAVLYGRNLEEGRKIAQEVLKKIS